MRGMLLLLGLNFEVIVLVGAAVWGGGWLTREYPMKMNWYLLTMSLAIAASVHSIVRAWKLIKSENKDN